MKVGAYIFPSLGKYRPKLGKMHNEDETIYIQSRLEISRYVMDLNLDIEEDMTCYILIIKSEQS